jgi:hypothetical protein
MPDSIKRSAIKFILLFIAVAIGLVAAWTWLALTFDYSDGERAGFVQKFSRKGWVCKTWEGELALVNLPGAMPEIFHFTVRDPTVAKTIQDSVGRRVTLTYEQHIGVPTSCFGDTQYFVIGMKVIE